MTTKRSDSVGTYSHVAESQSSRAKEEVAATALGSFHDRLLRYTIEWCRERSTFYAERFVHAGIVRGVVDLPRLPILRRDEVQANLTALLCNPGPPACVQYTTGTTGEFLPLYRSEAELAFLRGFYLAKIRSDTRQSSSLRPVHLALTSAYHGSPTPIPHSAFIVNAGVYDETQAKQAACLLTNQFSFPGVEERVSAVVGSDLLVKALTAHLVESGTEPSSTEVRSLIFTGGYTSTRIKRLLGKLWNASVIDRYSMSEVYGGAVQAAPDAPFVFDIEVLPEVVDPCSLEPIEEGVGVLLMTSLYPFSQMMPMIRYYTGDLVKIVSNSPRLLAVQFLGRERRSVLDDEEGRAVPLLLACDLHDLLEALPDVAASSRFRGVASDAGMEIAGKLRYAVDTKRDPNGKVRRIAVRIGTRYAPWLYPERVEVMSTRLRRQLYDRSPNLCKRIQCGEVLLELTFLPSEKVPFFTMK